MSVKRVIPFNKYIFIKASDPFSISKPTSIVKGIVVVCGQEIVMIKDEENLVFNITGVKSQQNHLL